MKRISLYTLALVFSCNALLAQSVHQRISEMDVDYKIRASEDPNFDKFLQEIKTQKELSKKASQASKAQKLLIKKQNEQARLEYIQQKKLQKKKQDLKKHRDKTAYYKEQKRLAKFEESQRKKFVAKKRNEARLQAEHKRKLIARMQARLSRLPASYGIEKRARIPKDQREDLYKKVLKQNEAQERAQRSRR